MKQETAKRLERLEGPSNVARLVLRDLGGGMYSHRGTGKTYTAAEVAKMGSLVTIVQTAVVYARKEGNR